MLKADDSDPKLSMPTLDQFFSDKSPENPGIISIFHDEASFAQNDVSTSHWFHVDDGPSKLRPKSNGANYMVSDFVIECIDWVRKHRVIFKTGPDNYWNNDKFLAQIKKVEKHLKTYFKKYKGNG